ncbi:sensor protein KdpD [Siphonobacter sp.]|uniref:sensor protein KdpD n=1 Tax=Siphonobacter sp. TaxID=1869184 RepID=UPI003B3BA724
MENSTRHFLELLQQSRRGKFKVYIGMSAGVGKTYRMLQEAHTLHRNGVDIQIAFVETHGRAETEALVTGLPMLARRKVFYKGKELEEMDLATVLAVHPEVVLVDELAHTNIPGSKNEKRWQDVLEILDQGISVISAVNIQHLESLNEDVERISGVPITERIPDHVLRLADEVVNIDLTADELIARLQEGKIYHRDKVQQALRNFFQAEKILQLRELALREVATQVERKIQKELPGTAEPERFMACISSSADTARRIIRKTARLASYYNAQWVLLYVHTPKENQNNISLALQRHLINNFKLATELGAEVIQLHEDDIAQAITTTAEKHQITTVCIGKPHLSLLQVIWRTNIFGRLLKQLSESDIDLIILS